MLNVVKEQIYYITKQNYEKKGKYTHPEFPLIFPETVATIQCHYKFIFPYLKCEDNYNLIWL